MAQICDFRLKIKGIVNKYINILLILNAIYGLIIENLSQIASSCIEKYDALFKKFFSYEFCI